MNSYKVISWIVIIGVLQVAFVNADNYIITTIAGTGNTGTGATSNNGDGSAATSAKLYNPQGLAVDSSGNVYIADTRNNKIRKVSI